MIRNMGLFVLTGVLFASCAGFPGFRDLESRTEDVVETVMPSVVELDVLVVKDASDPNSLDDQPFFEYFFGNPEGDTTERPREFRFQSLGAGVIIARDGSDYWVLSNRHVVGEGKKITVKLDDGREYFCTLVGEDVRKDIAIVRFSCDDELPVAVLGDSDRLRPGQFVLALGSPYGFQSTATLGIVSALHRRGGPSENLNDFIQTDASINQGNSGGALVNLDGELVGINTWISSQTGDNVGLGFAIPINNIKNTIHALVKGETPVYGWLGVHMQTLDLGLAKEYGRKLPGGILVCGVYPGTPADGAGIRTGDILLTLGNRKLSGWEDLVQIASELPAHGPVTIKGMRGNQEMEFNLQVMARPEEDRLARDSETLWPGLVPMARDGNSPGIPIRQVIQGSIFQKAGLQVQDRILSIDGKTSNSVPELMEMLSVPLGPGTECRVMRESQEMTLYIPENAP